MSYTESGYRAVSCHLCGSFQTKLKSWRPTWACHDHVLRSNDLSGSSRWKMQLGVSCASPLHHSTEFLINCDLRKLMMALGNLSGSIVRLQACHDPPGLQKLELSWMRITYSGATIFEAGLQLGQVSSWSPVEFRRTQRFFSVQRLHGFRQVVQHV